MATPTRAFWPSYLPMCWTFQTLDKDGMVLNMAQTWHSCDRARYGRTGGGLPRPQPGNRPSREDSRRPPRLCPLRSDQAGAAIDLQATINRASNGTARPKRACALKKASRTSSISETSTDSRPQLCHCHTQQWTNPQATWSWMMTGWRRMPKVIFLKQSCPIIISLDRRSKGEVRP